jgi:hypothetical protein
MTSPTAGDFLPIVTFGEEFEAVPVAEKKPDTGEFVEDFQAPQWIRRIVPKRESVDLGKLTGELDDVQKQVDKVLQHVSSPAASPGHMRLNQLWVSIGITAGGSIGVVTAGMQASLTLVYERT